MARVQKSGRTKGGAVVEFAISFGLLWAIFAGVFQFGYTLYVYNSLANAVAQGAHYAARVQFDSPGHAFVAGVKNMVVYGSPTGGVYPLAPGLNRNHVDVTWELDPKGCPLAITIAIRGYVADNIFHNVVFNGKPRMTVAFLGTYKT